MKILNTLALTLALATPAAAQSTTTSTTTASTTTTAAVDVLGTWNATVTTQQGPIPSEIKLRKDGDKIVGTIASQMGELPLEAAVKGKALSIWFNFQGQNGPMAIELNGNVDGDSVKGTMLAGGQQAGEFVATRAKAAGAKDAKPADAPKDQPAAAAKNDLSGTYNVTIELPNMTANPTMVLKQDGDKLSGDYVSAQYGKFPIAGTVKGADVTFSFAMNVEGNALNVTYTGTVDKDGAIKGSVAYGDMMSGTFTASKKK
jgi:hypothetical protein